MLKFYIYKKDINLIITNHKVIEFIKNKTLYDICNNNV